jgi:hypothetical protein
MKIPTVEASPALQRILGALERKPNQSIADLSGEAFVGVTTLACGGYVRALRKHRLIYVSGWRQCKGRFSTPLFSRGDLADLPRPRIDDTNRDAPGMHRIVETLVRYGRLSYREIAEFSGLSPSTVKNSGFLDALVAQGRIHVGGWRRSRNGPMAALYAAGPGTPAARPPAISDAEKGQRHRTRVRIAAHGDGLLAQLRAMR